MEKRAVGKKLTAYQKIKWAAQKGTGTRLTYDECFDLYRMDEAIRARADMDDEDRDSEADEIGSAGKYRRPSSASAKDGESGR